MKLMYLLSKHTVDKSFTLLTYGIIVAFCPFKLEKVLIQTGFYDSFVNATVLPEHLYVTTVSSRCMSDCGLRSHRPPCGGLLGSIERLAVPHCPVPGRDTFTVKV